MRASRSTCSTSSAPTPRRRASAATPRNRKSSSPRRASGEMAAPGRGVEAVPSSAPVATSVSHPHLVLARSPGDRGDLGAIPVAQLEVTRIRGLDERRHRVEPRLARQAHAHVVALLQREAVGERLDVGRRGDVRRDSGTRSNPSRS